MGRMARHTSVALPYLYNELLFMFGDQFDRDFCRFNIVVTFSSFDTDDMVRRIEKIKIETIGGHSENLA